MIFFLGVPQKFNGKLNQVPQFVGKDSIGDHYGALLPLKADIPACCRKLEIGTR